MLFGNVYPLWIYELGQFFMPPYLFFFFMCNFGINAGHFVLDYLCLCWGNLDTLVSQTCTIELWIKIRLCWRWADNLWQQLFGTVWGSSWPKWVCSTFRNEETSGKHNLSGKADFLHQQRLDEGKHSKVIQK